jgi:putative flippase GtrA
MPFALAARLPRLARFGAVGVVNTLVDVGLFTLLVRLLDWHVVPANILSYGAGILCSFVLNSRWTFAEVRGEPGAARRFARFIGTSLAAMGLSTVLVVVLSWMMDPLWAKAISVVVGFLANYAMARLFVFRARA